MQDEQQRKVVFLSHNSADFDEMVEIAQYLEERDIPCWYAPRDIPLGQHYQTRIVQDLKHKVEALVVIITEQVGASSMVPKEIDLALRFNIPIVPIMLDGTDVPDSLLLLLCNIQHLNVGKYAALSEALDQLIIELEEIHHGSHTNEVEVTEKQRLNRPVVLKNAPGVELYQLHTTQLQIVQQTFVEPERFTSMKSQLARDHFICLHHSQHTGKYSAAISLLQNLQVQHIYEISKDVKPKELLKLTVREQAGFILEIDSEDWFDTVSEHAFLDYIEHVSAKDSFLIFIMKKEATEPFLQLYSHKVSAPKQVEDMLRKHVNFVSHNEELVGTFETWLSERTLSIIRQANPLPRDVSALAQKIQQFLQGDITEEGLLQSLQTNVLKRIEAWFQVERSQEDIAFYLALGLFEGLTFNEITKLAQGLQRRFASYLGEEPAARLLPSRDEYLALFHATVKKELSQFEVGHLAQDKVRFVVPEDASYVWQYVWLQYPRYQSAIIEWLHELLSSKRKGIEDKVISIVVELLKIDFPTIRMSFVQPWAQSNAVPERMLAVRTLELLAADSEWTYPVFNLVKAWAGLRNNSHLQWTAMMLLSSELGAKYYPASLKMIRSAYGTSNRSLHNVIQRTMQQLTKIALWDTQYEKIYIRHWVEWFERTPKDELQPVFRFAQSVFQPVPALFFRAQPSFLEHFWVPFIADNLQHTMTRKTMLAMLDEWIQRAGGKRANVETISGVLHAIYESEADSMRIRLEKFVRKGLRQHDDAYRPIAEMLVKM
ncbi:toll/interleukin-1 receptor domain-containing protein [Bacillus sp. HMF5848]|uniref:toll/interleukin-1 receptor domain-containing protein n=1 Tax=Bacillus sp. HMF5848 TaxID=2495421 RepID=UPI000F7978BB|nr:toll/interleukin-1 receptor domain-containing protein [Bacillus sp. HMF5848]RSK28762.1 toll/interleukin-1 receptor domain-containing protein [Bacillus sp. HMF5848]